MANAREVILAVMESVQGVAKRDRNSAQGFNFRGIDAVVNKVGPALRAAGGFILPEIVNEQHSTALTAKGSQVNVVHLTVRFGIYGLDGEPIVGSVAAEAMDSGDKATAKAMSVALRTFLLQVLALPTDEPDPDSFTYEATRDFAGEAEAKALIYDVEGLRALYSEAVTARAPKPVLDKIKEFGNAASGQTDSNGGAKRAEGVA